MVKSADLLGLLEAVCYDLDNLINYKVISRKELVLKNTNIDFILNGCLLEFVSNSDEWCTSANFKATLVLREIMPLNS